METPGYQLLEDAGLRHSNDSIKFVFGSWFLYDSYRYCTQPRSDNSQGSLNAVKGMFSELLNNEEVEWVHYATGPIIDNCRIIERMITFPFKSQSSGYVEGDHMRTRNVLIEMADYGYSLHAVLHSHPGRTLAATRPSQTDLDHQFRMERGGYHVVSSIFSRDGFIRFFTVGLPFEVEIYGKGVEQIEPNTFHLTAVT
jgi:proteasome lid subunit RPN8/RPN11